MNLGLNSLKHCMLIMPLLLSTYTLAECKAQVCAVNPDMADERSVIDDAAKQKNETEKSAFDAIADQAFAPEEKMASSGCLDNMMGLNLNASLIDPRNLLMANFSAMFQQKITAMACSMATAAINKQVTALNSTLNDQMAKINKASGGLITLKSNTTSGSWGASGSVTQIQDSELGKKMSDKLNSEVNGLVHDSKGIFGEDVNIDFSDKKFYPEGSGGSSADKLDVSGKQKLDDMVCYLGGCN
ncbi:hypothetical protein V6259_18100 [Marinomonas sp. TI.3.20]|uniref:hypothetical protein n=1 Tax=Marinomonas sp. TI.3.20 TaxID=3121296 RepID=UPI0031204DC4